MWLQQSAEGYTPCPKLSRRSGPRANRLDEHHLRERYRHSHWRCREAFSHTGFQLIHEPGGARVIRRVIHAGRKCREYRRPTKRSPLRAECLSVTTCLELIPDAIFSVEQFEILNRQIDTTSAFREWFQESSPYWLSCCQPPQLRLKSIRCPTTQVPFVRLLERFSKSSAWFRWLLAAGVSGGSRPSGGSTTWDVRRLVSGTLNQ